MRKRCPIIGPDEKFYGYIVGLSVSTLDSSGSWENKMYATFAYNDGQKTYEVPDKALFKILSKHMVRMVETRAVCDDFGYEKLWIEKVGRNWVVVTP